MKLVEHAKWTTRVLCKTCYSKLEVDENDVRYDSRPVVIEPRRYYVVAGCCAAPIYLTHVPPHVQMKARGALNAAMP